MNRITIRLPTDLIEVIKRKARLKRISMSQCAKGLIEKGLLQELYDDENQSNLSRPSKIDQYLLKSGIECLLLLRRLIPEKDQSYISHTTQVAKEVVKKLLTNNDITTEK